MQRVRSAASSTPADELRHPRKGVVARGRFAYSKNVFYVDGIPAKLTPQCANMLGLLMLADRPLAYDVITERLKSKTDQPGEVYLKMILYRARRDFAKFLVEVPFPLVVVRGWGLRWWSMSPRRASFVGSEW